MVREYSELWPFGQNEARSTNLVGIELTLNLAGPLNQDTVLAEYRLIDSVRCQTSKSGSNAIVVCLRYQPFFYSFYLALRENGQVVKISKINGRVPYSQTHLVQVVFRGRKVDLLVNRDRLARLNFRCADFWEGQWLLGEVNGQISNVSYPRTPTAPRASAAPLAKQGCLTMYGGATEEVKGTLRVKDTTDGKGSHLLVELENEEESKRCIPKEESSSGCQKEVNCDDYHRKVDQMVSDVFKELKVTKIEDECDLDYRFGQEKEKDPFNAKKFRKEETEKGSFSCFSLGGFGDKVVWGVQLGNLARLLLFVLLFILMGLLAFNIVRVLFRMIMTPIKRAGSELTSRVTSTIDQASRASSRFR